MKRFIALFLACLFLFVTGCGANNPVGKSSERDETSLTDSFLTPTIEFTDLRDPNLLQYVEDEIYLRIIDELEETDYVIQDIEAVYISKEYLDELEYNSKENVFFGYSLKELDDLFSGTRYAFTLGEDGKTTVIEFKEYDDTYDQVIRNVAIGTGVILVCVILTVVTEGAGAPAAAAIFAASAKTGAIGAALGFFVSGTVAGTVTYIQTGGDTDQVIKAIALEGSKGYRNGAIFGSISGGLSEASQLYSATSGGLTMNEVATIQKQSGYPISVIKKFSSMEQYEVCRDAGLTADMVNGKLALIRDIDLFYKDENGLTNLERMRKGLAALDETGKAYELHHIGQQIESPLAILTRAEHMENGNNSIWHILGEGAATENPSSQVGWTTIREDFWKALAEQLGK